jgi:hypothetical protein
MSQKPSLPQPVKSVSEALTPDTRGERLIAHVPHGHWQTMTFIGALRHDRIEAP